MASDPIKISPNEVLRFITDCTVAAGADPEHGRQLAEVLVEADKRGHYSHGMNRLEFYVNDLKSGICKGSGKPTILREKSGTAWVDGNTLLGPVVGNFCMKLAIQKAKDSGIGMVATKGSNHFGIAGWYAMLAMRENMIGFSCTNGSPSGLPTRARQAILATNPIAFAAAPATSATKNDKREDGFVLDMATTTVAMGKVEVAQRQGETQIPHGWCADSAGRVTTSVDEALNKGGSMMPLGGTEETGGYKGFGLMMMVEILSGILSGSHWGPHVREWGDTEAPADLGHCFMAIDSAAFSPNFNTDMTDLLGTMRNLEPISPEKPVLVAGDPETAKIDTVASDGGITYHINAVLHADEIAAKLNVTRLVLSYKTCGRLPGSDAPAARTSLKL